MPLKISQNKGSSNIIKFGIKKTPDRNRKIRDQNTKLCFIILSVSKPNSLTISQPWIQSQICFMFYNKIHY